jgi:hypothetical protein
MIINFTENPFLNSRLNNSEFGRFINTHLQFLISANKNNQYDALIALLQPVYLNYDQWLEKYDKNITHRKGKTKTIDDILTDFKLFVKKEVYKEVSYKFESDNKEAFNMFFPKGLTEYSQITKKTANILFDRIEKACIRYKDNLVIGLDEKAIAFNVAYTNALTSQLSGKGNVKETSHEGETLRTMIAKVMYANLIDLLKIHIENPTDILALYDAAILNKNKSRKKVDAVNSK